MSRIKFGNGQEGCTKEEEEMRGGGRGGREEVR